MPLSCDWRRMADRGGKGSAGYRLLILAGSHQAIDLAESLSGLRYDDHRAMGRVFDDDPYPSRNGGRIKRVVFSLAGVSRRPRLPRSIGQSIDKQSSLHRGGFGGVSGLVDYIRQESIDLVVDATHPFAVRMSRNALCACAMTDCPRLVFDRPEWHRRLGDDWILAPDIIDAARITQRIGQPRRVLLTVGSRDWRYFADSPHDLFVRGIEKPVDLPARARFIDCRPPLSLEDEKDLLVRHKIDLVVSKNSGADQVRAKLDAARAVSIKVVMIARPPPPPGPRVYHLAAAHRWIKGWMGQ